MPVTATVAGTATAAAASGGAFTMAGGGFAASQAAAFFASSATLGSLAADAAIIGAGVSAFGMYQGGVAAKEQGKQQEKIMEYNAKVQADQAAKEEQSANYEADIRREQGRKLLASQRVGYAKAGVGYSGTPLLVFKDTASKIAQDVAMTRWNGQQGANYFRSQSNISLLQGKAYKTQGNYGYKAGVIGAGTSLLEGASKGAYQYYQMR